MDKAEVIWGTEIKGAILKSGMDELKKYAGEGLGVPIAILKFKSKKPKFNQVQYEGSPSTPKSNWRLHIPSPPKDNTKEVVPQEGPGDVYVMIDTLKMPGLVKIGTTTDINEYVTEHQTLRIYPVPSSNGFINIEHSLNKPNIYLYDNIGRSITFSVDEYNEK